MLILKRTADGENRSEPERSYVDITLPDGRVIVVKVLEVEYPRGVRLGFQAPGDVKIDRREITNDIARTGTH